MLKFELYVAYTNCHYVYIIASCIDISVDLYKKLKFPV